MSKYSSYHSEICKQMKLLAEIPNSMFIGQQCLSEDFYQTLKEIPTSKRTEMPVAEEMQLGISIGLAIEGYLPISIYQRMDFLPRACDQLVNHLDIIKELSRGLFSPKVIIRTTIGTDKPMDCGLQHKKDLIEGFRSLLRNISIYELTTPKEVKKYYTIARKCKESIILVERQELYYD